MAGTNTTEEILQRLHLALFCDLEDDITLSGASFPLKEVVPGSVCSLLSLLACERHLGIVEREAECSSPAAVSWLWL